MPSLAADLASSSWTTSSRFLTWQPTTLGRWLDRAAEASFLVTSREVLGLPGEEVMALPPLAGPDAPALFMRRAAAGQARFPPCSGRPGCSPAAGQAARRPAAGNRTGRRAGARDVTKGLAAAHGPALQAAGRRRHPPRPPGHACVPPSTGRGTCCPMRRRRALAQLSVFEGGLDAAGGRGGDRFVATRSCSQRRWTCCSRWCTSPSCSRWLDDRFETAGQRAGIRCRALVHSWSLCQRRT